MFRNKSAEAKVQPIDVDYLDTEVESENVSEDCILYSQTFRDGIPTLFIFKLVFDAI